MSEREPDRGAPTPGRARAGALARALPIAAFAAAFLATSRAIAALLAFPEVPIVTAKLDEFARRAPSVDTLFIGTSRTYRGIDPELFDRFAAEAGRPTTSFNLGIDALYAPEDRFVCERVFTGDRRLSWVFLEIGRFTQAFEDAERNERSIYWHDWERTSAIAHSLAEGARRWRGGWRKALADWADRAGRSGDHLLLFALRSTSFGRGAAALAKRLGEPVAAAGVDVLGLRRDGFVPIDRPVVEFRTQEGFVTEPLDVFDGQLAERRERPARALALDAAAQRNLDGILALVRAAGARPVLVIPPTTSPLRPVPAVGADVLVLDFSDPQEWPELFRREHRADAEHVNVAGAAVFTRALGQRWLAAIEAEPRGEDPLPGAAKTGSDG